MGDIGDTDPALVSPGAVLRLEREARRLSVEDVAQALKLTPKQVVAIESEAFDLLPGKTFARGFVRNYARLLQRDPTPLLAALETRLAGGEVDLRPLSNAEGRMPAGVPSRGVPRILLGGLLLAMVALAIGVYLERFGPGMDGWRPTSSADPPPATAGAVSPGASRIELPVPAAAPTGDAAPQGDATGAPTPQSTGPREGGTADTAPTATSPGAADPSPTDGSPVANQARRRLAFRFGKEAWVEVRDASGRVLASRLNPPGSTLDLEGAAPFELVVGNAASVELRLDDRPIDLKPHTSVSVARLRLE